MNFSVIIPTRKRTRLLLKLLESINANVFSHKLDIIIVHSGSARDFGASIKKFYFTNTSWTIKIFHTADLGPSHARNLGVRTAKWKHIIFVDDDCILANNFFQTYQTLWDHYPHAKIIGGKVLPVREGGGFTVKQLKFMYKYYGSFGVTTLGDTDRFLQLGELVYSANMSYRLSGIREKKLFDERLGRRLSHTVVIYAEDYELCNRILLSNEDVVYSPRAIAYNHISPDRFTARYLKQHASTTGMELALMEKILDDKFNGTYEKLSVSHAYKTAVYNLLRGKKIRESVELFNSGLKLRLAFSYLVNKYRIFR